MADRKTPGAAEETAINEELNELIVLAKRGEETAFKELFERHYGLLLSFCLKLCGGNRHDAEDIVSETFARGFKSIHSFKIGPSIVPWLITIARRLAIDKHRAKDARPAETFDRDLETMSFGGAVNATAEAEDRALRDMVLRDTIRTLSQAHREILIECYWRGRSVPEAAEVLNIPLGTAKSRIWYAVKALRDKLPHNLNW